MAVTSADFFTRAALLDRLTDGVKQSGRPVVFLVGSAITAPVSGSSAGVPNVSGVIDLIRDEFAADRQAELEDALALAGNKYQEAFSFLLARRGQNFVNNVVKRAVWKARKAIPGDDTASPYVPDSSTNEEMCVEFDAEYLAWSLTPAAESLGRIASNEPKLFGQCILTTNFDPLIEVSIGRAGGSYYRTSVHRDGDLGQTAAPGCHVIHLHGYWHGGDTLHTPRQLTQDRPRLKASLAHILRSKTLVVCGYGGWDDVFTKTLLELIQDDRETPEVIWTFFGEGSSVESQLLEGLRPGLDRGAVTLYHGIDCHEFLPALSAAWAPDAQFASEASPEALVEAAQVAEKALTLSSILPPPPYVISPKREGRLVFDARDQDRPPLVEYYVGRSKEAELLDKTKARVIFLTGIGGEGKSALAANYVSRHRRDGQYEHIIWRDCKEESERFESQIVSIVHILANRQISISELSKLPARELFDIFLRNIHGLKMLLIFDNVDHYVDLERGELVGSAAVFVEKFLNSNSECRVMFTCRPSISASDAQTIELRLGGLDLQSTEELFQLRKVTAPSDEIARAHELTRGHAFWLDLIAAQISRNPDGPQLDELLTTVAQGEAGLPIATLQSIWSALKDREQVVLRGLAEAVRPITALQLSDYLSAHVKWNQVSKAVKYLRGLNLIVVKLQEGETEVLELHPVVRAFVRRTFAPAEQAPFVNSILKSYLAFFGIHRSELAKRPRPETIDRWIEAAEVSIQAERYEQAFEYLHDVCDHFQSAGHSLSFIRVTNLLMMSNTWSEDSLPKHFDSVFTSLFDAVAAMGRDYQCQALKEMYADTISHKNARYINYCDIMCGYYWIRGDYFSSMKWGVEGVELKKTSNVDTAFDASHHLALAQRDSGAVDAALNYFLKGKPLQSVTVDQPPEKSVGGAYYGNIGRCLHFMGQINQAMICYKKSALVIEDEITAASLANKGYIRQWVGEMAYSKGDRRLASACFSAAAVCWELIAPPKAEILERRFHGTDYDGLVPVARDTAERIFAAWTKEPFSANPS